METPLLPLPVPPSQKMCRHQKATRGSGFRDWFKQSKSYSQASAKSLMKPELNILALLEQVYLFICFYLFFSFFLCFLGLVLCLVFFSPCLNRSLHFLISAKEAEMEALRS